jgi:cyclase
VGTLLPAIKVFNNRDVDELIILDINATRTNAEPDYQSLSDLSEECFVPLTVGGGIKNIENVKNLLKAGADKICINSATYDCIEIVSNISSYFGSQSVVVSIDAKKVSDNKWVCYSHSGTREIIKSPSEWAKELADMGAGEILITSIDNEGMMEGYDIPLICSVTESVNIPVIASGGAGNYQHFFEAIDKAGASAVSAASMFLFTEQTPREAKDFLLQLGVPVRTNFT